MTSPRVLGGRYEVRERLGRGGMALVFRGHDRVLNRPVAIKVLARHLARDPKAVERFRREARAAARLNHPGIVTVYDSGSQGGAHYIVMELVDGRPLSSVLRRRGRLSPAPAFAIAFRIAQALAYAHRNEIVHRDVKPANIMVTRSGRVKIMDFGIARVLSSHTLTDTAAVLGTASYLSPEQAQGRPIDARSDVYALGVVLYQMLTGRPPFVGESPISVAFQHIERDPEPPSRTAPDVPPDVDAEVLRALAKDPAERHPSADELAESLQRVRSGLVDAPAASDPARGAPVGAGSAATAWEPEPEPQRGRLALRVGAVVALGMIVLLAVGFLWPNPVPSADPRRQTDVEAPRDGGGRESDPGGATTEEPGAPATPDGSGGDRGDDQPSPEPDEPDEPTGDPTEAPTEAPTDAPTEAPTEGPTDEPSPSPPPGKGTAIGGASDGA